MAHASRNERKKRRIKRTNSLLSRSLRTEQSQRYMSHAMLCAILAQQGGEATVTAGTMQQVQANMARLAFRMEPIKDDPSAFVVRLIETDKTDSIPSGVPPIESTLSSVPGHDPAYDKVYHETANGELHGDD